MPLDRDLAVARDRVEAGRLNSIDGWPGAPMDPQEKTQR